MRKLRALAPAIRSTLVHTDALSRAASPQEACDLVVDPTGSIELATASAAPIVDHPDRTAMISHWIYEAERDRDGPWDRLLRDETSPSDRHHGRRGARESWRRPGGPFGGASPLGLLAFVSSTRCPRERFNFFCHRRGRSAARAAAGSPDETDLEGPSRRKSESADTS